jgi:hypothetical protein
MTKIMKLSELPEGPFERAVWPWREWAKLRPGEAQEIEDPKGRGPAALAHTLRCNTRGVGLGLRVMRRGNVVYIYRPEEAP